MKHGLLYWASLCFALVACGTDTGYLYEKRPVQQKDEGGSRPPFSLHPKPAPNDPPSPVPQPDAVPPIVLPDVPPIVPPVIPPAAPIVLTGDVKSALTGLPLSGVLVSLAAGPISVNSDLLGNFRISNVPVGAFNLSATLANYTTETVIGTAVSGINPPIHIVMSPVLAVGAIRVVLTWGAVPTDLDTHLFTTFDDQRKYHIFYMSKTGLNANLDVDDVTSFGPETLTIQDHTAGHYSYNVYDYTNGNVHLNTGSLATSGAVVKVYEGSSIIYTFTPTNTGREMTWHVFNIDFSAAGAMTLTPIDTYSSVNLDTTPIYP